MPTSRPRRLARAATAAAGLAASVMASTPTSAPARGLETPTDGERCAAGVLGTARTLALPRAAGAYGTAQHGPLPLAPGEVVLTFDDGPRAGSTPRILQALAAQCVRATFFMNGEPMLREPALARRVRDEGHSIGMHSHRHAHLAALPEAEQREDMARMDAAWREVFGAEPAPAYRFPFLEETPALMALLAQRRVTVLSVDAGVDDWLPLQSPATLAARLVERLKPTRGGIVLLHDAQDQTADALPLLLTTLKAEGYRVVHLTWKSLPGNPEP